MNVTWIVAVAVWKAGSKALPGTDLVQLFRQLNDLKRIRQANSSQSIAEHYFTQAWRAIYGAQSVEVAALSITAKSLARITFGAIDLTILRAANLSESNCQLLELTSYRSVAPALDSELGERLVNYLNSELVQARTPTFVDLLASQPRAGATKSGCPRLIVLPQESHADHCLMVAIYSVLLSSRYGANPQLCFLAALSHHLHNAYLPDSGFAGEELLGEHLHPIMQTFQKKCLAELDHSTGEIVIKSLASVSDLTTPEGRAFHAADVLDRALQMQWYENASHFTLRTALEEMDLVHAGPVRDFQMEVLKEASLC